MKKIMLLVALVLCMILCCRIAIPAQAETLAGTCGENLTWSLDTSTGVLTISGTGPMTIFGKYSNGNAPWNDYDDYIQTVVIASGVTSIGDEAFSGCENLTSVTIPDTVTSIGEDAFNRCSALTSVTIPGSIGAYAFAYCYGLTSITIQNADSIGNYAFYRCRALEEINYNAAGASVATSSNNIFTEAGDEGDGITVNIGANVTHIPDYLFRPCSSYSCKSTKCPPNITSVHFAEGSICENIGRCAFYDCATLTSINIPDTVTTISEYAFRGCAGLTEIHIPSALSSLSNYAFTACSSLTGSITLPDTLTAIEDGVFSNCSGLTEIKLPETVTRIGYAAFDGCASLKDFLIPKCVTSIDQSAFRGCASLESISVPDGVESIATWTFEGCVALCSVELPESIKTIGQEAFKNCCALTSIEIPDGVNTIGYGAFSDCTGLTDVTIGSGVTSIDQYAFSGCTGLTSITIPDNVTSLDSSSFSGCSNLEEIVLTGDSNFTFVDGILYDNPVTCIMWISPKIAGAVTILDGVSTIGGFSGCTGLTSITLPDTVTAIDYHAFYGCTGLTSVTIPSSVKEIAEYAFYGCENLENVYFPDLSDWCRIYFGGYISNPLTYGGKLYIDGELLTDLIVPEDITTVTDYAFQGCSSLRSVTVPDHVIAVGKSAFSECKQLTAVTIGDGVTSIGENAFDSCPELRILTIGRAVTRIGKKAFNYCTGLTEINFNAAAMDNLPNHNYVFAWAGQDADGITVNIGADVTAIPEQLFYPVSTYNSDYAPKITTVKFAEGSICQSIGYQAFYYCSSLTDIAIPDSVTSIGYSAFSNCTNLTNITLGKGLTTVYGSAFSKCRSLTSVILPDSLTTLGGSAFAECTSLKSVNIPAGVTTIENYTFQKCTSLESITIPSSVTTIDKYAFSDCTALKSITIPSGLTTLGDYAFNNCTGLTQINYDAASMSDLTSKSNAFTNAGKNGDGITVNFGANVKTIPAYLFYSVGSKLTQVSFAENSVCETIGGYAFYNCSGLTEITIPKNVTSIGKYSFSGCTSVTQINYYVTEIDDFASSNGLFYDVGKKGSGITVNIGANVTKIPAYLFYPYSGHSPKIISVHFEEGSACQSIGRNAFSECKNMAVITIPATVTAIGDYAFSGCTGMWHTLYKGTQEQWDAISIGTNNTYLTDAIIHCNCKGDEVQDPVQKVCSVCCPHTYEVTGTTQPTCTEPGTTTYNCTACGYSCTREDIPATGHSNETVVISTPTCAEPGVTQLTCTVCGHIETKQTPALGHDYVGGCTVDIAPTEKTEGHLVGTCVVCSAPVEATLPALNMVSYTFTVVTTATEDTPATGRFTWNETAYGKFYFDVTIRYGDVNGDGMINGQDVILLRKFMANLDYDAGLSTVAVFAGADANGDGKINGQDVILLRKYMANLDYETGISTVPLGPQ